MLTLHSRNMDVVSSEVMQANLLMSRFLGHLWLQLALLCTVVRDAFVVMAKMVELAQIRLEQLDLLEDDCESEFSDTEATVERVPLPWIGIDLGGTMSKAAFFVANRPVGASSTTKSRRREMIRAEVTLFKRAGLLVDPRFTCSVSLMGQQGRLYFSHIASSETSRMIASSGKTVMMKRAAVCATGGGAKRFKDEVHQVVGIELEGIDEMAAVVKGVHMAATLFRDECYELDWESGARRVVPLYEDASPQAPFLIANIGSGISIILVTGPNQFRRVAGTPIGGATALALGLLMCGVSSWDELVRLAAKGDARKVNKLVGDIYGSGYDGVGLPSDCIAACLGKVTTAELAALTTPEDRAAAALTLVAANVTGIALLAAHHDSVSRILVTGNFLRMNSVATKFIARVVSERSKGEKRAVFLRHEGYIGALGCLGEAGAVRQQTRTPSPLL